MYIFLSRRLFREGTQHGEVGPQHLAGHSMLPFGVQKYISCNNDLLNYTKHEYFLLCVP